MFRKNLKYEALLLQILYLGQGRSEVQMSARKYVQYVEGLSTPKTWEHFERTKKIIPGGASSNARCYPVFDPYPIAIKRGKGSHIWDIDDNEYIDFLLGFGPLILGHCHPKIIEAVKAQMELAIATGYAHELVQALKELGSQFQEARP